MGAGEALLASTHTTSLGALPALAPLYFSDWEDSTKLTSLFNSEMFENHNNYQFSNFKFIFLLHTFITPVKFGKDDSTGFKDISELFKT